VAMKRSGKVGLLVAVLCLATLHPGLPSAGAHDHGPPPIWFGSGDAEQPGALRDLYWGTNDPPFCRWERHRWTKGFYPMWPTAVDLRGREVLLRIEKPFPPDSLGITYWRRVRADFGGKPVGTARNFKVELEPVISPGRLFWEGKVVLPKRGRHFYVVVEGHWSDTEACIGDQFAEWLFHLQRS